MYIYQKLPLQFIRLPNVTKYLINNHEGNNTIATHSMISHEVDESEVDERRLLLMS